MRYDEWQSGRFSAARSRVKVRPMRECLAADFERVCYPGSGQPRRYLHVAMVVGPVIGQ